MLRILPILILLGSAAAPPPAALPKGPLEMSVDYPPQDTGTMHFASRVTIRWADSEPLVLGPDADHPDADGSEMLLIPGPNFLVSTNRALLLGWSSVGAGMESIQALLIERKASRLWIADWLNLQTDRSSAAVLLRLDAKGWRIGIFRPERIVFDEEDWFLNCRGGSLDMDGLRRLHYIPRGKPQVAELVYQSGDRPIPRPSGVAWIEIGPQGFGLPSIRRNPERR